MRSLRVILSVSVRPFQMTMAERFAACNITPQHSLEGESAAAAPSQPAASDAASSGPAAADASQRPVMPVRLPLPMFNVPSRYSSVLPKAIFLDLHMPVLDGFQTALAIRKLGFDMPLIALTASVGTGDRRMADSLGFQQYITKPVSRLQLRQVLQRAVHTDEHEKTPLQPQKQTPQEAERKQPQ